MLYGLMTLRRSIFGCQIVEQVALAKRVEVWSQVLIWCKFRDVKFGSVKEILQFSRNLNMEKKTKKALHSIFIKTCWMIWKARNEAISSCHISEMTTIIKAKTTGCV
ncbi:hypothetical protein L1987_21105 [Smallanthus sonchifolius]|uniref:Uncharacterized protein n=1 Tax=Smallanthus sonchifolius TaxID=185202 RepID=A0ACB9ITY4_9ASTR|nr:hypothetical protein L1987_21105 [Smallanthus sonchifolius]